MARSRRTYAAPILFTAAALSAGACDEQTSNPPDWEICTGDSRCEAGGAGGMGGATEEGEGGEGSEADPE